MTPSIDWKRVRGSLFRYIRTKRISKRHFNEVLEILPQVLELCGPYSLGRRNAVRVGIGLLQKKPRLLATVCPDYTNDKGRFTYEGLLDGVPLLVRIHEQFLRKVVKLVPHLDVGFLVADHEADFTPLRQSVHLTREEFLARVTRSIEATSRRLRRRHWSVSTFTDFLPHYREDVDELTLRLEADPELAARLGSETLARSTFFRRVGYPPEVWHQRSTEIAAQYTILGSHCAARNIIICNHSTISLGWFIRSGVGFLENPVAIH